MEKFYFEVPSIERKEEALDYMDEFNEYKSPIHGTGGLNRYLDNYEGWLEHLEEEANCEVTSERVPARTYFLIRENDNKIIGTINIRLDLNESLRKYGGHIGYGIRPTERGKGYNKINLYLGLIVCDSYNIPEVFMDANLDNPASWKTMEALGGKRTKEYYNETTAHETVNYIINVKESLEKYKDVYNPYISSNKYN